MNKNQEGVEQEAPSVPATNTSLQEYTERRKQQLLGSVQEEIQEQTEQPEEVAEEVPENDAEVSEVTDGESEEAQATTEETEGENDVLSQVDLDDMTDEELQELSEKLGSRAVARFGELTAKRKAAEAELEKLKSEMQEQAQLDVNDSDNPYSDLKTVEELQNVLQEVEQVIEWADDLIFNADGYSAEDVITEIDGKKLTKSDVRQHLLNARKAEKKFIPSQLKKIQRLENAAKAKTSFEEKANREFSWMKEDGGVKDKYQDMLNDPRLQGLQEFDAEIAAQLPYLLAHAANSMFARKPVQTQKTARLQPPSSTPGAAKSEKRVSKSLKNLQDASNRFRKSGNKNDFIRMRALQFQS